jgi:hypothetical protein
MGESLLIAPKLLIAWWRNRKALAGSATPSEDDDDVR